MIAGILIIACSSILFVYWLRYSCLLLLRSAAERAGAKSVDERFNVARVIEGLKTEADLAPLEHALERAHCMIEVLGPSTVFIRDLGSTNGTYVKDKKISSERLFPGDQISIGQSLLRVSFDASDAGAT